MNGVIIVNKPQGKTSHDIVGIMRSLLKTRRVGHTGTLDPLATGVLPICIGNATKAADMLTDADKIYRAVMLLGIKTDTLDTEGEITSRCDVNVTEADIKKAASEFVGKIDQIPPMYSAIKKDGKKLYELARAGIEIEREPRSVTIHSLEITKIDLPRVEFVVHCSKGTYIRSLCDDLGAYLGCGAVMEKLTREMTGGFSIDNAYSIDELREMPDIEKAIIPTDELFSHLPAIYLNEKQERSIVNGVRMTWRDGIEGQMYRLYAPDGRFLCISKICDTRLVLVKSFWI